MKHATATALAQLSDVLVDLRTIPGLVERTPGSFYRGSKAFLHFHEDPAGLFADAKLAHGTLDAAFERCAVNTATERRAFVAAVRQAVEASRTLAALGTKPKGLG